MRKILGLFLLATQFTAVATSASATESWGRNTRIATILHPGPLNAPSYTVRKIGGENSACNDNQSCDVGYTCCWFGGITPAQGVCCSGRCPRAGESSFSCPTGP